MAVSWCACLGNAGLHEMRCPLYGMPPSIPSGSASPPVLPRVTIPKPSVELVSGLARFAEEINAVVDWINERTERLR